LAANREEESTTGKLGALPALLLAANREESTTGAVFTPLNYDA
jgi:hypothetical protein